MGSAQIAGNAAAGRWPSPARGGIVVAFPLAPRTARVIGLAIGERAEGRCSWCGRAAAARVPAGFRTRPPAAPRPGRPPGNREGRSSSAARRPRPPGGAHAVIGYGPSPQLAAVSGWGAVREVTRTPGHAPGRPRVGVQRVPVADGTASRPRAGLPDRVVTGQLSWFWLRFGWGAVAADGGHVPWPAVAGP